MPDARFAPALRLRVNALALTPDAARTVTDVTVTNESSALDQCTVTLANAYPAMRWTHTPESALFDIGNRLTVELGYVGSTQQLFDGDITVVQPDFPESGVPTVQITAHSRLYRLARGRCTRPFRNTTDADIARQIANEAQLTPDVEQTTTQYDQVMQHNLTNLEFLRGRARLIGFEVRVEGDTLAFKPPDREQGPGISLEWGRTLRSFRPRIEPTAQVTRFSVRGWDEQSKQPIVGQAGTAEVDSTMGGAEPGTVLAGSFGDAQDVEVFPPPASQAEADDRAAARLNAINDDTVVGEAACVGSPDVRSGRVVELTGVGPRFSGSYYVRDATHSFGAGGYETRFSVARSAVG